jgi:hypothetical protein
MKIYFNTGRLYTAEGQVITAEWDGKDSITFRDHSRGIGGTITTCNYNWDEWHLAKAVMAAYDMVSICTQQRRDKHGAPRR